jgi:hypothetical protein
VAVLSVSPMAESEGEGEGGAVDPDPDIPRRRIAIELGDRRIEGEVHIDMPLNHRRVLDYLNRAEPFLLVRTPARWYLVRKSLIARVVEIQEG